MFKVLRGTTNTNKEALLVYKGPFTQNMFLHQKKKRAGRAVKPAWAVKLEKKSQDFYFLNSVKCIGEWKRQASATMEHAI